MTSDDARLVEIRARADAASPETWTSPGEFDEDGQRFEEVLGGGVPGSAQEHQLAVLQLALNKRAKADAEFIAAARSDVPWLLDRLAEQTAEVVRLQEELDHEQPDDCRVLASLVDDQADQIAALTARLAEQTERGDVAEAAVGHADKCLRDYMRLGTVEDFQTALAADRG